MESKIIEFKEITKSFNEGRLIANNKISFSINKGDIFALIGENGAGKSTLLSMLFGAYKPDSGKIYIRGKEANFKSSADASLNKLGMVYQHFQLVDNFSVAQNIILGREDKKFGFLTKKEAIIKIQNLSEKYNFNIKPNAKIKKLTVSQKQKVEILKLLYSDAEILILDEPTSMLIPSEIEELIQVLKLLQKEGKTIIFVSHKLAEVKELANRGVVIRKGQVVNKFKVADVSIQEMGSMMVGSEVKQVVNNYKPTKFKETVLEVNSLKTKKVNGKNLNGVNIKIKKGEVISLVGVEGNGQDLLANVLMGLANHKDITEGTIKIKDKNVKDLSIRQRYQLGVSFIPEDRHKFAVYNNLTVYENASLKRYYQKPISKYGLISINEMKKYAHKISNEYDVRGVWSTTEIVKGLSGGNQQKLVVGRELSETSDLIIACQPTRGVDIGAINNIHKILLDKRKKGSAILLITYELDEALELADKIIVINDGKTTKSFDKKMISREKIGMLMGGNVNHEN